MNNDAGSSMLSILLLTLLAFPLLAAACCSHYLLPLLYKNLLLLALYLQGVWPLHMRTRMHMSVLPPALLNWLALPAWHASLPRFP